MGVEKMYTPEQNERIRHFSNRIQNEKSFSDMAVTFSSPHVQTRCTVILVTTQATVSILILRAQKFF